MATCVGPPATIIMGSTGVFIGGLPAARMGDPTAHGGSIVFGSPNVIIGEVGTGAPGRAGFNAVIGGLVAAVPADQDSSWLSQFGSGLFDSTLAPIGHMIAHPILTAEGIGHAVAHPIQTGNALGSAIADTASGVISGDPRAMGTAIGTVSMLFIPGAGEADVAEDAARIGKLGEVATTGTETSATFGRNAATWYTDAQGRLSRVESNINESFSGLTRSSEERAAQSAAGAMGEANDVGGHALAHRFIGDQGSVNIFAQDTNFNNSAYKTLENEMADWTKRGYSVQAEHTFKYDDLMSTRPSGVDVSYDVLHPVTGESVYYNAESFSNTSGQTFTRVWPRDYPAP